MLFPLYTVYTFTMKTSTILLQLCLQVNYVKGVDWYLMTSFLFIFLSLVECVLVERLASKMKESEAKEKGLENEGLVILTS